MSRSELTTMSVGRATTPPSSQWSRQRTAETSTTAPVGVRTASPQRDRAAGRIEQRPPGNAPGASFVSGPASRAARPRQFTDRLVAEFGYRSTAIAETNWDRLPDKFSALTERR